MADEKTTPEVAASHPAPETTTQTAPAAHSEPLDGPRGPVPRPAGWMYKGFHIGKHEFWYASPAVQLLLVGFVCFLCPGMFNAISGLGAGGQVDATAQDNSSVALYSTFAVVAFFSGTIANRLGVQLTLSLGGLGYVIYVASFLCYNHTQNDGFVIFAGALLGVCAGMLWTAQGTIMMSYPPEDSKGRYISWFWIIFNLGAVIGSLLPLGENINKVAGPVTDGTYAGFIVLTFLGAILALVLCNADRVQRVDGSHVILMKNPSWWTEIHGLYETLKTDYWIVLLFPMFWTSNIPYTYQGNDLNAAHFNTRTRALNNTLYWTAQIFGAIIFGYALDYKGLSRSLKAKINLGVLAVLTMVIWGGGWAWQKDQAPREVVEAADKSYVAIDWTDGAHTYIAPMFLFIFMGFFDAAWQTSIYWYMGALSNNGRKVANYAGFYKGIQ
jgi:hypothetical protein